MISFLNLGGVYFQDLEKCSPDVFLIENFSHRNIFALFFFEIEFFDSVKNKTPENVSSIQKHRAAHF